MIDPDDDPVEDDLPGVGYKNPPRSTRFKAGESGNRAGRPKGAKGRKTILEEIAAETHRVKIAGEIREEKYVDLLFMRLRERALQGDALALEKYEDLLLRFNADREVKWTVGLVAPEPTTPETSPLKIENVDDD